MLPITESRILVHSLPDSRRARMPREVSVFFHHEGKYDCPECKFPMERLHVHGWFWGCSKCKKSWPLYILEPHIDEAKVEKHGFLGKFKSFISGGKHG